MIRAYLERLLTLEYMKKESQIHRVTASRPSLPSQNLVQCATTQLSAPFKTQSLICNRSHQLVSRQFGMRRKIMVVMALTIVSMLKCLHERGKSKKRFRSTLPETD